MRPRRREKGIFGRICGEWERRIKFKSLKNEKCPPYLDFFVWTIFPNIFTEVSQKY